LPTEGVSPRLVVEPAPEVDADDMLHRHEDRAGDDPDLVDRDHVRDL